MVFNETKIGKLMFFTWKILLNKKTAFHENPHARIIGGYLYSVHSTCDLEGETCAIIFACKKTGCSHTVFCINFQLF